MQSLEYIGDIIPEDFKVIGFSYLTPVGEDEEGHMEFELEYEIWDDQETVSEEIEEKIKDMADRKKGRCNHCNAHISYIYIVKSLTHGTIHTFGSTCGVNLQNFSNAAILNAQEINLKARIRIKNEKERTEFLSKNPGLKEALQYDHYIIENLSSKFQTYNSLSPKQVELVHKIVREQEERKVAKIEREKNEIRGHHFTEGAKVVLEIKRQGKGGSYDTQWGTTYIDNYITPDNMVFKYVGSNPPEISDEAFTKVKATIKHDNYKGQEETKLQRIKII